MREDVGAGPVGGQVQADAPGVARDHGGQFEHGGPGTVHSAAAKAGVIAMSRSLAVEWGPRNVQVNCLCPGFVDTEQTRTVL